MPNRYSENTRTDCPACDAVKAATDRKRADYNDPAAQERKLAAFPLMLEALQELMGAEFMVAAISAYTAPEQEASVRRRYGKALAECGAALKLAEEAL